MNLNLFFSFTRHGMTTSPESCDTTAPATARGAERPYSAGWYEHLRATLGDTTCRRLAIYAIPADLVLTVVIPVYNEEATLLHCLERVMAVPIRKEILLVDDASTDGTYNLLANLNESHPNDADNEIRVFYHEQNQGKGAALKTAFQQVQGDIIIIQDADLEYDPAEFPNLIHPIVMGKADVVYGSRFLGDHAHRVLYYWHYLGNRFLTTLSNCFTNLNLTDMETCYKVFRRSVLDEITPTLKQCRFGIEPELTAKVARRKFRIYERSISYSGRSYEDGKKIGWRDGLSALWCILRFALRD